jgi:hypothetical protein
MKDDLFQLIKSLDKNEKGYFKKFTARYGAKSSGNDYLKLFNLLDKAPTYDELKLKAQFSKSSKKFNLSAQKKYLYQQIIRSLRSYSSGKNSTYSLYESILDIQNLLDKNLSEQAFSLIAESQKKASQTENLELQLQLKLVEDKLIVRYNRQFSNEHILKVKEEIKKLTEQINTELLLSSLLIEMKKSDERRGVEESVPETEKIFLEELMKNPVFDKTDLLRKKGKLIAHNVMHVGNMLLKRFPVAISHLQKMQALYTDMEMDTSTTINYLSNTNNLLVLSVGARKFDEAERCLKILENNRYKNKRLEEHRKTLFSKNLIFFLFEKSHYHLLDKEIEDAEKYYLDSVIELSGNNNLFSCYYLGILNLGIGKLDNALNWIRKTIDHENTTYINVQAYCRIVAAIIHYEKNNFSLVESSLQNMNYFMKKNNFQTPYLKNIALLISKLTMLDSSREKEKHFQKIVAAVEKMNRTELKGEPSYFHTLDMMVWAKSKLNKTNYAVQLVKSSAHSI